MKTTIELSDNLFDQAKAAAHEWVDLTFHPGPSQLREAVNPPCIDSRWPAGTRALH
jgi:hypothetical protein